MTGVFDSLVSDMHSNQITSSSYQQQQQHHSLHKPQESPTLPVSTATDSSYYTNQQQHSGGAGGGTGSNGSSGSPYAQMGSYQYHPNGIGAVPYSTKAGSYDLGYSTSYSSYATYGTRTPPINNEPGKILGHKRPWGKVRNKVGRSPPLFPSDLLRLNYLIRKEEGGGESVRSNSSWVALWHRDLLTHPCSARHCS